MKRKIISTLGISLCCLSIVGLSAVAGNTVYASAAQAEQLAQSDIHEERMLARTIGEEDGDDQFDWAASSDTIIE